MKYEAIIFDKDGTIIDFDSFWISVSKGVINEVLLKYNSNLKSEILLNAIGVFGDKTDANGVLCKGTYEEIAEAFFNLLKQSDSTLKFQDVYDFTLESFNKNVNLGVVKGTCDDIDKVFAKLKTLNVKLAVITTDNYFITEKCLKTLNVFNYFDCIYTDDGKFAPKPNADAGIDFMKKTGISKDKILMVGDTLTDATFAKNAGFDFIGVAKTNENKSLLSPFAKKVINDLSYLYNEIGEKQC
jgi:HAD superfamily hydrolase (TIGR01549 family)